MNWPPLYMFSLLTAALVGAFGLVIHHDATWNDVSPLVFTIVGAVAGVTLPTRGKRSSDNGNGGPPPPLH